MLAVAEIRLVPLAPTQAASPARATNIAVATAAGLVHASHRGRAVLERMPVPKWPAGTQPF
eukprot:4751004-Pyramimonas_sp.AAC.1